MYLNACSIYSLYFGREQCIFYRIMSLGARYVEHQTTYRIEQKSNKRYLGGSKAAGHSDSWQLEVDYLPKDRS